VLVEAGANVDAMTKTGHKALIEAAQGGSLATVQVLLAAKADVNARKRDGSTALMVALQNDHPEVVNLPTSAIPAGAAGK